MGKKAHTKRAVKAAPRIGAVALGDTRPRAPFDRPAALALDSELASRLAGLSRFAQEIDDQGAGIKEPAGGWRAGFVALVVHARCPFCGNPIDCPSVRGIKPPVGLTWSCAEGCNP